MIWNPWATLMHALALLVVFAGINYGQPLEKGEKVRPYQFGFTIEDVSKQHRFEKRDERGIIMGEFGFITADGIYHVTVYATDEEGKFRILAMRNYPYESPPKTIEMIVKPKTKPVIVPTTTARSIVEKKPLPKYNFNGNACSGCFLKKDLVKDAENEDTNLGLRPVLQPPTITNTITGIVNEMIKMVSAQTVLPTLTITTTRKPFVISTQTTIPATNTFVTAKMFTTHSQIATRTNTPIIPKFTQQTPATKNIPNRETYGTPSKTLIKQPLPNSKLGKPVVSTGKQLSKPVVSSVAQTPTAPNSPIPPNTQTVPVTPTTTTSKKAPEIDIRLTNVAIAPQNLLPNAQNPAVQQRATAVTSGGKQKSSTPNTVSGNSSPSDPSSPSSKSRSTAAGDNGDLYHFKYLLDYNGHEETGARNGNKVGNFFSIGDDNVERTIEYIANEFGYQPRIRWRKLDAARTKPAENALKEYEFVWFKKD